MAAPLQGFLEKQGKPGMLHRKYHRRWFQQDGTHLKYYITPEHVHHQGVIDLAAVTEVKLVPPQANKKLQFELLTPGRTYQIRALSDKEYTYWTEALKEIVASNNGGAAQEAAASIEQAAAAAEEQPNEAGGAEGGAEAVDVPEDTKEAPEAADAEEEAPAESTEAAGEVEATADDGAAAAGENEGGAAAEAKDAAEGAEQEGDAVDAETAAQAGGAQQEGGAGKEGGEAAAEQAAAPPARESGVSALGEGRDEVRRKLEQRVNKAAALNVTGTVTLKRFYIGVVKKERAVTKDGQKTTEEYTVPRKTLDCEFVLPVTPEDVLETTWDDKKLLQIQTLKAKHLRVASMLDQPSLKELANFFRDLGTEHECNDATLVTRWPSLAVVIPNTLYDAALVRGEGLLNRVITDTFQNTVTIPVAIKLNMDALKERIRSGSSGSAELPAGELFGLCTGCEHKKRAVRACLTPECSTYMCNECFAAYRCGYCVDCTKTWDPDFVPGATAAATSAASTLDESTESEAPPEEEGVVSNTVVTSPRGSPEELSPLALGDDADADASAAPPPAYEAVASDGSAAAGEAEPAGSEESPASDPPPPAYEDVSSEPAKEGSVEDLPEAPASSSESPTDSARGGAGPTAADEETAPEETAAVETAAETAAGGQENGAASAPATSQPAAEEAQDGGADEPAPPAYEEAGEAAPPPAYDGVAGDDGGPPPPVYEDA